MIYEVMKYTRNFFSRERCRGTFTISGGTIDLPIVPSGKYILVEGSGRNDGVHEYTDGMILDSEDEVFTGTVTVLAPPNDFLELVDEISGYVKKCRENPKGRFQSESFDGYSYTLGTNADGSIRGWKDVYRSQLSVWKKV